MNFQGEKHELDSVTEQTEQTEEAPPSLFQPLGELEIQRAIISILHQPDLISEEHAQVLQEMLDEHFPQTQAPVYGPDFDLTAEVNTQLAIVNAMRDQMIDPRTHRLRDQYTSKEAKELNTASKSLMDSLTKAHTTIINAERQRAIEEAVIRYASNLEEDEKQKFLAGLEEELEKLE